MSERELSLPSEVSVKRRSGCRGRVCLGTIGHRPSFLLVTVGVISRCDAEVGNLDFLSDFDCSSLEVLTKNVLLFKINPFLIFSEEVCVNDTEQLKKEKKVFIPRVLGKVNTKAKGVFRRRFIVVKKCV